MAHAGGRHSPSGGGTAAAKAAAAAAKAAWKTAKTARGQRAKDLAAALGFANATTTEVLGVPIGDSAFVASKLLAKANELGELCETTLQLVDREVAWRIFQVCLLASGKYHSRMLPPNIVAASAKRSSVHLRKAYEALLSEGHGPGVGVTEELKLPASPHANANAEAKARYEQKRRRYELLTTMLRLPYRRGGMAVSTPDLDTAAHFLAGRTEMMEHLRKYSVPWKPAIGRWHADAASSERRAVEHAFTWLQQESLNNDAPFPSVDILLKEKKLSPRALMSRVEDRLVERAEGLCKAMGGEGNQRWASIRSNSDNYARAPLTAPLSPKPLCHPATFVAMLRTRAGMDMGWPKDAMCKCNKARVTTEHVMTCPSADLYQMRHNSLLLAMIRLVRSTGATARPEPLLRQAAKGRKDRLDIDVTYGDTRVMMDVTVAATCRAAVRGMNFDAIEPGCATRAVFAKKTAHYQKDVEKIGKELQIIAFDSAGCPAPQTRKYLERWIKAATPESDDSGIMESQHGWRAMLARSVLQAQAVAVTNMRRILTGAYAAWA